MIRLSKSCLSKIEKDKVLSILDKEYLGMGHEVEQFEYELSNYFSRPVACVSSGTAALHLALQALGLENDDEVLVQTITYVGSFQAIVASGARPVACDVDPSTMTIDLKDAEKRLTKKTKALMLVHYAGGVGNLGEAYTFAKKNNLRVIEDAAHAFGTVYNNSLVGSKSDIACFSFDGIKNITSGEGGCITTNDRTLLKQVADTRLLGVENDTDARFQNSRTWEFDVKKIGWRYHMSDIMAAIGRAQLSRFEELSNKRRLIAKYYDASFCDQQRVSFFKQDYDAIVPHIYPVRIAGLTLETREALRNKLNKKGIQVGIHYQPNHLLSLFSDVKAQPINNAEAIYPELLSLPLHPDIEKSDVDRVVSTLLELV
jgi:dTDP-4-amino-4,6-dideoxygalactose transaminase